jgi:2,3-bisphosphoglycerate-dependent phosphoglycerate mutase
MKLNLILFRHGELHSRKEILCGWLNLVLSSKGEKEAKALSKKLKKEKIDVAFCSDLIRSQQVLLEVLKYHKKSKVVIDHRLRERHFGALSGELKSIFADTSVLKKIRGSKVEKVPGVENISVVRKRVFPFMTQVLRYMQDEKVNVCISAHKESLILIQEYLEGLTPDEAEKLEHNPTEYKKYVINFE